MYIQPLEPRRLLAGVTILTHGNDGNITGWVKTAANDIVAQIGKADTSTYVMTVKKSGSGLAVTSFTLDGGPGLDKSATAEAVIRLDWSSVSDGGYSTQDVGDVVAAYLQSRHGGTLPPLASLPMHLIGHSRGASVMSDIAQRLGEHGIWVDQVTYLDPHPVDGGIDNGFVDDDDPQVRVWDNVTFADNYWRDDGLNLNPDGEKITGTLETDLNDTVGKSYPEVSHLAVPSYYIGTINPTTSDGGDLPIISSWYSGSTRTTTGWNYSRLGGEPRPVDGLRAEFGGTAERRATTQGGTQWGNVDDLQVLSGTTYTIGQRIPLRIKQQDRGGNYNITIWLDTDKNPFNDNNARKISARDSNEADTLIATRVNGSTSGIEPGTYYAYARIVDASGHARYTYSRRLTLKAGTSTQGVAKDSPPPAASRKTTDPPTVASTIPL